MRDEKLEGCHFFHMGIEERDGLAFVFFISPLKFVSEERPHGAEAHTSSLPLTVPMTGPALSPGLHGAIMELESTQGTVLSFS